MTATPAAGYEFVNWTEGTTAVSSAASYTFTLNAARSLTANFTVNTPVSDLSGSGVRVWPNPVTSELRISGMSGRGMLNMYNIAGKLLLTTPITTQEATLLLDRFQPGIYVLVIETPEGREVRKMVKK